MITARVLPWPSTCMTMVAARLLTWPSTYDYLVCCIMASQRHSFFADSGPWLLRTVCALRVRVALLKATQSLLEKSGRVQRDRPTTNRKQTDTDKHGADTRTKHNTNQPPNAACACTLWKRSGQLACCLKFLLQTERHCQPLFTTSNSEIA